MSFLVVGCGGGSRWADPTAVSDQGGEGLLTEQRLFCPEPRAGQSPELTEWPRVFGREAASPAEIDLIVRTPFLPVFLAGDLQVKDPSSQCRRLPATLAQGLAVKPLGSLSAPSAEAVVSTGG